MKIQKHNPEAEVGVIGALIADGDYSSMLTQEAMLRLREEFFYNPVHKELFKVIRKCFDNKHWFDFSSMMDAVRKDAELADFLMASISGNLFTGNRMMLEIEQLERLWELRGQYKELVGALQSSYDEPLPDLASQILFDGIQKAGEIKVNSLEDGADYEQIADSYLKGEFAHNSVVETGIKQFAEIRNGSLITIAGGSGVGKTFFGIYLMHQIAIHQPEKQCLFFSLEMARNEIWERHIAIVANKPFEELSAGDLTSTIGKSLRARTKVYDQPRIDIDYIETVCLLQSMRQPLSVVVVDYIGLVTSRQKYDREDLKVSDITQRLTALALKLKCVVIGLTQVNRDPAKRTKDDRCPYPSDVADSVGSVRSSSMWIGIDRPELYQDDFVSKNLFVAKCRKNRRGDNFEAYFDFNGGRFAERQKPFYQTKNKDGILERLKKSSDYRNQKDGDIDY